jgi:SAM-dependent methyltransferase
MNHPASHLTWKHHAVSWLRRSGLLMLVDHVKFWLLAVRLNGSNSRFQREHPEFITPPLSLAYDAYSHIDLRAYHDSGLRHATYLGELIRQYSVPCPVVLEWGCGPVRILRHLRGVLPEGSELHGCDYNPATVDWCRKTFPQLHVILNHLEPPVDLPDSLFDVIYALSVFTHLSEPMHIAWKNELVRLLKPGGILIVTLHGDRYRNVELLPDEQAIYDRGELVVRGNVQEGKKWFAAFHPPVYVRNQLFADMIELKHEPSPLANSLEQDVWVLKRKGRASRPSATDR